MDDIALLNITDTVIYWISICMYVYTYIHTRVLSVARSGQGRESLWTWRDGDWRGGAITGWLCEWSWESRFCEGQKVQQAEGVRRAASDGGSVAEQGGKGGCSCQGVAELVDSLIHKDKKTGHLSLRTQKLVYPKFKWKLVEARDEVDGEPKNVSFWRKHVFCFFVVFGFRRHSSITNGSLFFSFLSVEIQ